MKKIKLVCIGAGYFSRFHVEAWTRIAEVELSAICDQDEAKAKTMANEFGITKIYTDYHELFSKEQPDVADIITPPNTHYSIAKAASAQGIHIICQKPLAPSFEEAESLVWMTQQAGVRLMIHENWRFQPWYRQIKKLIEEGAIGHKLHTLHFRMRTGDGWSDDAYLNRQPYFRTMPRLLIYETGIHFIDTFRYLAGEVTSVFAKLRRLNSNIAGEDAGVVLFDFTSGAQGILDANRYNEPNFSNPRYTFGEMLIEGSNGSIRLYPDGSLTLQTLGKAEKKINYLHEDKNFAGDCVFAIQQHFVNCFLTNLDFETNGRDYLKNLQIQEAIYQSSEMKNPIDISSGLGRKNT